jgi:hypothetical protein
MLPMLTRLASLKTLNKDAPRAYFAVLRCISTEEMKGSPSSLSAVLCSQFWNVLHLCSFSIKSVVRSSVSYNISNVLANCTLL